MTEIFWELLAKEISTATGKPFHISGHRTISGGCINEAYCVSGGARSYFVKFNQNHKVDMFAAEFEGLLEMHRSQTIRVPQPICYGVIDGGGPAYIVMEWLPLGGSRREAWAAMGQQLAAMHRTTSDRGFGWHRSNTIGETPQLNDWDANWVSFFQARRLGYQFQLGRRRGGRFARADELLAALPRLLNHDPVPALLHGDLWSGNAAVTEAGEPVILDPATYYGDREADLAMTELFGRFPQAFYGAYQAAFPLAPGYERRRTVYNLYHIVNHFNLFGGGYLSQANRMIDQILG
ncbi:MAG: fructosamine kinase family protein [Cyanobacteria bacterium P01_A01_bin.105]